ncbi:hypothetical protein NL676_038110 [Syzygium grande]|nr:hypothetical protein NL676_038110 [Syzygium grande]
MNNVYKLRSLVSKTGLRDEAASSYCVLPQPPRACPMPARSSPVSPLPMPSLTTPSSDPMPTIPLLAPALSSLGCYAAASRRDNFTFPFVLKSFSRLGEMGHRLHALIAQMRDLGNCQLRGFGIGCGSVDECLNLDWGDQRARSAMPW